MVVVLGLFCNPSDFSRKEKTQPHRKKLQCPKLRYKIRVFNKLPGPSSPSSSAFQSLSFHLKKWLTVE
jgi:hypothetical protein